MSRPRSSLLLGIIFVSALLGYFLRDVVYQLVVVPLAYLLWLLNFYYSAIPQWVLWTILLAVLFLMVLWSLLPEARGSARKEFVRRQPEGQVEALAVWITKSRQGNYFKWQLANRLGRIARRLNDIAGPRGRLPSEEEAVEKYIDAGLNYSFVDFPSPRKLFERAPHTPLDLDPGRVADYLESQMENTSDRRR
jgi:hypothetical protein